jgi:hypothetical protein
MVGEVTAADAEDAREDCAHDEREGGSRFASSSSSAQIAMKLQSAEPAADDTRLTPRTGCPRRVDVVAPDQSRETAQRSHRRVTVPGRPERLDD